MAVSSFWRLAFPPKIMWAKIEANLCQFAASFPSMSADEEGAGSRLVVRCLVGRSVVCGLWDICVGDHYCRGCTNGCKMVSNL
jgi:hypothetical protein